MPTIFNGGEEVAKRSFTGNMLCRMMGMDFDKVLPAHKADQKTDIEVCITFNGHEIDAGEFFKALEDEWDYSSQKQAAYLLLNKLGNVGQKIMNISDRLEGLVRDEVRKAFPDFRFDDDED